MPEIDYEKLGKEVARSLAPMLLQLGRKIDDANKTEDKNSKKVTKDE